MTENNNINFFGIVILAIAVLISTSFIKPSYVTNIPQDQYGVEVSVKHNDGNIKDPLEWYLSRKIAEVNLTADIPTNTVSGFIDVEVTYTLNVSNATYFQADQVGNTWIELWEGNLQYQGEVVGTDNVTNQINVSLPIKFPFTTSATVYVVDVDQNRDFSDTGLGEQNYTFDPAPGSSDWYITRFIVTMLHEDASDSSTYGDIYLANGLPNGVAFCGYGTRYANETGLPLDIRLANCLFNLKTNRDYESIAFDVTFNPKGGNPASPQLYGTSARKTFSGLEKSNLVISVRDDRDEFTLGIFRDDLSSLNLHRIRVMGYRG